jgi:hypothetical protein
MTEKIKINVEDIYRNQAQRRTWNVPRLEDIEFYKDGELVPVPKEVLEDWKFMGLNNEDFVTNNFLRNY